MNKIIVASYMGSGSSAATDLLREFEGVACPNGSYEYVFLHCPNGVFDLEDKLLLGNNVIRSDEALRAFRAAMAELNENGHWWFANYREKLSPSFMGEVDAFIDTLVCCTYEGFWYDHEKVSRLRKRIARLAGRVGLSKKRWEHTFGDKMTVSFPSPDLFYGSAATFVDRVLGDVLPVQGCRSILLDQLFLPHNLNRLPRYFPEDAKAVVVQRDPRDVFVMNKYVWKERGCPVPLPYDVETFCRYYRAMRQSVPAWDEAHVVQVWFEDLVLNYASTAKQLSSFFGSWMGAHERPRTWFDPMRSRANVGVFLRSDAYGDESRYIESHLTEYLYPGQIPPLSSEDTVFSVF